MLRPDWYNYFFEISQVVSKRSTCIRRRYGAVIAQNNIIISTGYNGSPRAEQNCIDSGVCQREVMNIPRGERYELCVGVHAEQNAIINADSLKMKGSTIYVAGFNSIDESSAVSRPCLLCQRMIKNALLEKVVYWDENGSIISCRPEQLTYGTVF